MRKRTKKVDDLQDNISTHKLLFDQKNSKVDRGIRDVFMNFNNNKEYLKMICPGCKETINDPSDSLSNSEE